MLERNTKIDPVYDAVVAALPADIVNPRFYLRFNPRGASSNSGAYELTLLFDSAPLSLNSLVTDIYGNDWEQLSVEDIATNFITLLNSYRV
jgi:hypothetical protein